MLTSIFRRDRYRSAAERLYLALGQQARRAEFFAELGIPDTVDGRFDLLVLHVCLIMRRLRQHPDGASINQSLFDAMFRHLDLALSEMGVQDLGVGRRIKAMAEGFHGRATALDQALSGQGETLEGVLTRNVFGKAAPAAADVARLADYVRQAVLALDRRAPADILAGGIGFPDP